MTPEQRSMKARIAAHASHARGVDPRSRTAAARSRNPGTVEYWEDIVRLFVDVDGTMPNAERRSRAEHAKAEHFQRLAFQSSMARGRAVAQK